jgi:HKD family nuclease
MPLAPPDTLFDEITDFLSSAPTTEAIIAFKPSEALDQRLHDLLDKNSRDELTGEEQTELHEFLRMNHFLKMLRLKARLKHSGDA